MLRCILVTIPLLALFVGPSSAAAVDFFWEGPDLGGPGGNFRTASNWTFTPPPFPLVPAPGGEDDTANFDLGRTPQNRYTVTNVRGENSQLVVHNDSLTLVIPNVAVGTDYELLSEDPDAPSFVVGSLAGDVADVILMGSAGSVLRTFRTEMADANGSAGTVTVDNLEWFNESGMSIGGGGGAQLVLQNGANLSSGGAAIGVGQSSSAVIVDGAGSTWNIGASISTGTSLNIGFFADSDAELAAQDGGSVVADGAVSVAVQPDSNGAVHVTGADSSFRVNGNRLVVGSRGNGTMTIDNGGGVTSVMSMIGSGDEATGTVTVVGTGSTWELARLSIGGDAFFGGGDGGAGALNVQQGGTVRLGDITLYPDGRARLLGGELALAMFDFQGGQFQWTSGTLRIGTFDGDLTNPIGGTLSPGPGETGTTTITGNYTQQVGATLGIEIGGTANGFFDTVAIEGNAFLAGTIDVSLVSFFAPTLGDTFTILETPFGSVSGQFTSEILPTTPTGLTFDVLYPDNQTVMLQVVEALVGDYNDDGVVDAADYVVWRENEGTTNHLPNNPFGGTIGPQQYFSWRANFGALRIGNGATSASGATGSASALNPSPEPATLALLALALASVGLSLRERHYFVSPACLESSALVPGATPQNSLS